MLIQWYCYAALKGTNWSGDITNTCSVISTEMDYVYNLQRQDTLINWTHDSQANTHKQPSTSTQQDNLSKMLSLFCWLSQVFDQQPYSNNQTDNPKYRQQETQAGATTPGALVQYSKVPLHSLLSNKIITAKKSIKWQQKLHSQKTRQKKSWLNN